jgi:hypothetical protein
MADEGVLDLDLLGGAERAPHGSRVHEDAVVNEKGRRPLALTLTAVRPEDSDLQRFLQSGRARFRRIIVYQGLRRQGEQLLIAVAL